MATDLALSARARSVAVAVAVACVWAPFAACGTEVTQSGAGGSGGSGATGSGGTGTGGTGTGGAGATGGGGGCVVPPPEVLSQLTFGVQSFVQLMPGQSRDLGVGVVECCYVWNESDACVAWSVTPPGAGATIDAATGLLAIAPGTANGAVFSVTADVGPGAKLLTLPVYVYTQAGSPLVGIRHEVAELPCGGGAEIAPEVPIAELAFWADHSFQVTWMPFELYVDYWGTYSTSLDPSGTSGTLTLNVSPSGNYVPPDVDGSGTFSLSGGDLVLHDMWLGTPSGGVAPAQCGHRFQ